MSKIDEFDVKTPLWTKLSKLMEERLAYLRKCNDADLDPVKTAAIRGQIRECEYWLKMGRPSQPIQFTTGPQTD